jgi:RHS repeat-associated protein
MITLNKLTGNLLGEQLIRKIIIRFFSILIFLSVTDRLTAQQMQPYVACSISGTSPVYVGSTYTYTLSGGCSASSWTVTCGTIQSSTSTTVTVYFNVLGCSSSTITAVGTSAAPKTVTVNVPPIHPGSISPSAPYINYNTSPGQLTLSGVSGGTGSYTYQWQYSPDNTNWYNINGAINTTYTPGNLTTTTYYRVVVSSGGLNANSAISTVTVYPQLVGGSISPASATVNFNSSPGQLTLSGVSGGSGIYTYQWQSSPDNSSWVNINGAISATYTPGNLLSKTYYQVLVTSNGATVNSSSSVISVNPQVFPGVIYPVSETIASGTSPGIIAGDSASGGACNNNFTYQWQSSTDDIIFININGATGLAYTPGNLSASIYYRRKVFCVSDSEYTDTSHIIVGTVNTNLNYIRIRDITKPIVTDTVTSNALTDPNDVKQTTNYFDGMGRLVETVSRQSTPLKNDMVSFNLYDNFGRQSVQYMPYPATTNDGNFKTNPLGDQYSFYSSQYSSEQFYYGSVNFESSPLNRVSATYAPGYSWVASNHGISNSYLVNTGADSVQNWTISFTQGSIPVRAGAYPAGQLFKIVSTDENNHQIIEYRDLQGRAILKKVQLSNAPGTAHMGWLNTYYVYDNFGELRFVISPRAVELINGSWTITQAVADGLCYRYEYDQRHRVIIKKLPGAGEAWIVYDARDRIVMTQDSALRVQGKWSVIKYDSENRPDSTGLLTDANSRSYHQNLAYNSTNYPGTSSNFELLTQAYYDDYIWTSAVGMNSSMATSATGNSNYFITSYNSSPMYAQAITQSVQTRGMATGTMTKVVGTTNQYLYTASFYDIRGRVLQSQSINYTGGLDTSTIQYDFSGKVLRSFTQHRKSGNTVQGHHLLTKLNYDAMGRLLTLYKNIDDAASDQLLTTNTYNELGQLQNKALGNNLENLAYGYTIRGWLATINKNYVNGSTNSNYFGMELGYDNTSSVAGSTSYNNKQFNGSITGTVWKSAGDGIGRKYDFTYDNSNRITAANFVQNTSGSAWDSSSINFTTNNLSYDANGNILTMNQKGFKVTGPTLIDQLTYTYLANSNKLSQVNDAVNDSTSKLGDFHYSGTKQATDYSYDGNGNLLTDNNKAIDNTSYNYMNLPQLVHMNGKGNIQYTYDAAGRRMKKVITDSISRQVTNILYIGGFIYQQRDTITNPSGGNDTLQYILHEEGRTRWAFHKYNNGNIAYGYEYDFFVSDHLGNTRVVLTQQKDTAKYLASMEAAYRATETQLFSNITTTSYPRTSVAGYPNDTSITNPNDSLARVNGNGQKVGPGLLLKVMHGDTLDIATQYYFAANGTLNSPNNSINDVLNSLATGLVNMTSGGKGSISDLNNTTTSPVYGALNSFLPSKDSNTTTRPKAYLNWILLDEQLHYVNSYPQSGAMVVVNGGLNNGQLQPPLTYTGIQVTKSGYLYVWVSNETPGWDVYFDNLSVTHRSGPMLEENHYYEFGLQMAAITSKALKTNYAENKLRYNEGTELQNKEFSDGSGLETYETTFRGLDPQLGRFAQIDPLSEWTYDQSPYQYGANNPIFWNDPLGASLLGPGVLPEVFVVTPYRPRTIFGAPTWATTLPPFGLYSNGTDGLIFGGGTSGGGGGGGMGGGQGSGGGGNGGNGNGYGNGRYLPLYKGFFLNYVKTTRCQNCSTGILQNAAGMYFQDLFEEYVNENFFNPSIRVIKDPANNRLPGELRNTVPDYFGIAYDALNPTKAELTTFYDLESFFELKATKNNIGLSTFDGQIKVQIQAAKNLRVKELVIISTYGVNLTAPLQKYALDNGIRLTHYWAQYMILPNNKMKLSFTPATNE